MLEFSFFRLNIICIRKHKRKDLFANESQLRSKGYLPYFFFVCVYRSMQMKEQENFENLHFTLATAAPKLSSSRKISHNPMTGRVSEKKNDKILLRVELSKYKAIVSIALSHKTFFFPRPRQRKHNMKQQFGYYCLSRTSAKSTPRFYLFIQCKRQQ